MEVCDGSRGIQGGRKSCNMLKGLVHLVNKTQQPDPVSLCPNV